MHIIWHGQSCFQIIASRAKGEQISIVIDPFDQSYGLRVPNLAADILLITHDHSDHNNKAAVRGLSRSPRFAGEAGSPRFGEAGSEGRTGEPFLITGPGEYEIKEVFIQGIAAFHDAAQGKEKGGVTIFTIETEEMRLCHLSDLGQKELAPEQVQKIGDIDVLMIPVGGRFTISAREAQKVVSQIDPKIIIPMHYQIPKLRLPGGSKLDGVDSFLKLMGRKQASSQPKLLIKQKDLPSEGRKIIVLSP